jgi:hypothetical protein
MPSLEWQSENQPVSGLRFLHQHAPNLLLRKKVYADAKLKGSRVVFLFGFGRY